MKNSRKTRGDHEARIEPDAISWKNWVFVIRERFSDGTLRGIPDFSGFFMHFSISDNREPLKKPNGARWWDWT
jgi:hypothetical protein